MNKKNKIINIMTLCLLMSCNKIRKDYIVTDASVQNQPKWVKKMVYNPKKSEYKYFVSKADNINQELCQKGAEVRARAVIASEIASEIYDAYEETAKSNNIEDNELATANLKQTVSVYLSGAEVDEKYWEKRSYKKNLGAEKDINKYFCYTLMKMNKENYNKVVNLSLDRMFRKVQMDDIKEEVKNKLIKNNE